MGTFCAAGAKIFGVVTCLFRVRIRYIFTYVYMRTYCSDECAYPCGVYRRMKVSDTHMQCPRSDRFVIYQSCFSGRKILLLAFLRGPDLFLGSRTSRADLLFAFSPPVTLSQKLGSTLDLRWFSTLQYTFMESNRIQPSGRRP